MRILIAVDKFKGSLTAMEAGEAIACGIREGWDDADIRVLPIADGGEGFAASLAESLAAREVKCPARGPMGRELQARYFLSDSGTAVMEMSAASGLVLLDEHERDPRRASTRGTGDMILHALDAGADRIILGIGGSATNDAGAGMADALGWKFTEGNGVAVEPVPANFMRIEHVAPPVPDRLAGCRLEVACDVSNPLLGRHGATMVYGSQKGLAEADLQEVDHLLRRFSGIVQGAIGKKFSEVPGSGAAGGLGFGLMAFAGAVLKPGFRMVADVIGLEDAIRNADIVVTGEGSYDAQSESGKGPGELARIARECSRKVVLMAGQAAKTAGFDAVYRLMDYADSQDDSMKNADGYLRMAGKDFAKRYGKNCSS